MRVYLAGPMRGHDDLNFPAFHRAAAKLREIGVHVVFNPAEEEPGLSLREALAKDLAWLCSDAEMVVVLDGWEESLGAKAEIAVAEAIGIPWVHLSGMVA